MCVRSKNKRLKGCDARGSSNCVLIYLTYHVSTIKKQIDLCLFSFSYCGVSLINSASEVAGNMDIALRLPCLLPKMVGIGVRLM